MTKIKTPIATTAYNAIDNISTSSGNLTYQILHQLMLDSYNRSSKNCAMVMRFSRPRAAALLLGWAIVSSAYAIPPPVAEHQVPTSEIGSRKQSKPQANPDASGVYHAGDGVIGPKLISSFVPEFSDKARKRKLSGSITLQLVVGVDGHVDKVQVIKSAADDFTDKKDRA